ncbi:MAG: hypothetical protein H6Q89_4460, partial [Myxococcaceae bacterium]|nr:hypothetical protein [Myxococcaceae bacterium]
GLTVRGEVEASGPQLSLPSLKVRTAQGSLDLSVSKARLEGLTDLSARLEARFADDRVAGSITGSALEGKVAGRFDVPASGSAKNRKLSAHFTLENASIAGVWKWVEGRVSKELASKVKDPAGKLTATVDLEGSAGEPKLKAQLAVDDGAITYVGADRFTGLTVRGEVEASGPQLSLPSLKVRTAQGSLDLSAGPQRHRPPRRRRPPL